jgi:hypothetical protein
LNVSFFGDDNEIQGLNRYSPAKRYRFEINKYKRNSRQYFIDLKISPVNIAQFRGKVIGDLILGEFTQVAKGSFQLQRTMKAPIIQQEPKVYVSGIEAVFYNDSIKNRRFANPARRRSQSCRGACVRSGQQDRDETVFGFKPFQLLPIT